MEHILDSPTNEEQDFQYTGFWIRVGAYFIDAIILWIANSFFSYLISSNFTFEATLRESLISLVLYIFYFALFESSPRQATPGKMAVGIKVGDREGNQLSIGHAFGRYFAKFISAIILCIGFMMVGWDDKKQGLHDKLANTYVFYV